uniref:Transcription factor IIIC 90kDa subunit N-terminal domain-containing protein n=1 Tax=Candidozyma auris TaxID=498019 RepID=A0A0L0NUV2_CANAR
MTLFKPLIITRAVIENSLLDSIQCSENLQVAVNNSDHLIVLDPKLPSLNQCVNRLQGNTSSKLSLDLELFYDVNKVFNIKELDSFGLQMFSKLLVEDGEDRFTFGRIAEPTIVAHSWSRITDRTRDCYLGLLLNTGEVLVLKRESQDAAKYNVIFRTFLCLLDQLSILQSRLTKEGDLIVNNTHNLELRVTSFEFGKTSKGGNFILLAHANGQLSIHKLSPRLPETSRVDVTGTIVKQEWSDDGSSIALVRSDNSVVMLSLDENATFKESPKIIKTASRYLVSRLKILSSDKLVVTDTRNIYVFSNNNLNETELPHRSTILCLSSCKLPCGFGLLLGFETGQVLTLRITSEGSCTVESTPQTWSAFVQRAVIQFQLLNIKEQRKAPSKIFEPMLNHKVEGNFSIHGGQISSNGQFIFAYSIAPRNVIHYETISKAEFNIGQIAIIDFFPDAIILPSTNTPIAQVQSIFLEHIHELPVAATASIRNNPEAMAKYLDSLANWKTKHFVDPRNIVLDFNRCRSLQASLSTQFHHNDEVSQLQKVFTFNILFLRALEAFETELGSHEAIEIRKSILTKEQESIKDKIIRHLGEVVLGHTEIDSSLSYADKFIYLSFWKLLPSEISQKYTVPDDAKLVESTDLVTETFMIQKDIIPPENFQKYAYSESSHAWRRCDLTMLPILSLDNKTDELEVFVYSTPGSNDSELATTLQEELDYCIYTGNRTFKLKVGL